MKYLAKYSMWIVGLFVACILSFSTMVTAKADADATPPLLSVSDTTIRTYVGSEPVLNVTATDDVDGETTVSFTWSENALDEVGCLTVGEHTCTVTATDSALNTATATLTYIVTEDTANNEGYVFVTVVCEGMKTVVTAYKLNDTIDTSAYAEKMNYTKAVKNSAGEIITDFTATADCTLYDVYNAIIPDYSNSDENPSTEPLDSKQSTGRSSFVLWASLAGLVSLVCIGVIVVKLRGNKGDK